MKIYKKISKENRENIDTSNNFNYKIVDGKVENNRLEINVANHCNLSCRGCSHASPTIKKDLMDIQKLEEDLTLLSTFFRSERLRILGGEPLLHPNLETIIKKAKEINIADKIQVVTNGVLIPRIEGRKKERKAASVFSLIDELSVSLYKSKQTEKVEEYAKEIDKKYKNLEVVVTSLKTKFRESITKQPTKDKEIIKTIYETCWVAHFWKCVTLDNGYLFRCPQQIGYAKYHNDYSDALLLTDIKSVDDILRFLENNNPIKACSSCLGMVGTEFKHRQIKGREFFKLLPNKPEDAIDWKEVKRVKKEILKKKTREIKIIDKAIKIYEKFLIKKYK